MIEGEDIEIIEDESESEIDVIAFKKDEFPFKFYWVMEPLE